MVDVTSYGYVYPLLAASFVTVWILSRSDLAPGTVPARKPRLVEVAVSIIIAVYSAGTLWLMYTVVPASVWSILPRPKETFRILTDTLLLVMPVALSLHTLKAGRGSVRLTAANWRFSLILGICASVIFLIPTTVLAPVFVEKLLNAGLIFLLVTVYGVFSEELFFRGFLQTRLEGFLGQRSGLLLTAVIFNLSHYPADVVVYGFSPMVAASVEIFSLPESILFGYIALKSNNLLGSILFHFLDILPLLLLPPYASYF